MEPRINFFIWLIITFLISSCEPNPPKTTSTAYTTYSSEEVTSDPTIAPSLLPTLNADLAGETIRLLMQGAVDCDAPCFWGISPGKTEFAEAKKIFARLGLELVHTNTEGSRVFYTVDYDFERGTSISPILTVMDDIVESINVNIPFAFQQAEGPPIWSAYSLNTLITRYGPPTNVDFIVGRADPAYEIVVYFKTRELIVSYFSYDLRAPLLACPLVSDFSIIRLWFGSNPENPPRPAASLEDAADLTIDEFSELMTGDPSQTCIALIEEMFP